MNKLHKFNKEEEFPCFIQCLRDASNTSIVPNYQTMAKMYSHSQWAHKGSLQQRNVLTSLT